MLILVIPSGFPTKDNPTSGIFVWEQCLALRDAGHKMIVLDATGRNYKRWLSRDCLNYSKIIKDDILIYSFNYPAFATDKFPSISAYFYGKCLAFLFKKLMKDNISPDIVHAHFSLFAGYKSLEIAKILDIPLIVTEHYSLFRGKSIHPRIKKMLNKTIQDSDKFLCVSTALLKDIKVLVETKKPIEVLYNLISPSFTFNEPNIKDHFNFFTAGNLIPSKKMDLLIEAFTAAFKGENQVILEIAGDGTQFEYLDKMINRLGMKKQIRLLGKINRKNMVEKMNASDVFILLSESETFGVVYREAMAIGRPIIAARNGGVEENWDDSQGILVPINDLKAATKALREIKSNINSYNNMEISRRCRDMYSEPVIVKKLECIYEVAISNKRRM